MLTLVLITAGLILGTPADPQDSQPATRPAVAEPRVLIVSVDGLRPDVLLRADAPNVRGLMDRGAFTFWAQTTQAAVTLPSHCSMLTGVRPEKHGIQRNRVAEKKDLVYPKFPTLFEAAHNAGFSTAMVAGKDKFDALAKPGTVDDVYYPAEGLVGDRDVLREALRIIGEKTPQVLFVHLPEVDSAGHDKGWGAPEQVAAVEHTDAAIGAILAALDRKHLLHSTLVIVTADHGGAGKEHGPDDPRSRYIPWIVAGPGVRKGYDLARFKALTVVTEDTFATAANWLGIALGPQLDGRPVLEMYETPENPPPTP